MKLFRFRSFFNPVWSGKKRFYICKLFNVCSCCYILVCRGTKLQAIRNTGKFPMFHCVSLFVKRCYQLLTLLNIIVLQIEMKHCETL